MDTKKDEKSSDKSANFFTVIAVASMVIGYFITERLLVSLFLSLLLALVSTLLVFSFKSIIGDIKSTEKRKSGIKKLVLGVGALAIVIVIFANFLADGSPYPKCVNCGKNAIWSETGYCRSCYKKVESLYR